MAKADPNVIAAADWTSSARARELLADCATNPPRKVRGLAPLHQVFAGGPEHRLEYCRNDDRVDELGRLQDEAFSAVYALVGRDVAGMLIGVDEAIDTAIAGAKLRQAA
jgi:hypothetical protein